jgi:hypothetical protein
MLLVNFLSGRNSFTLKQIFSSRMVFLEGNHSEPEIVSEKVLLSVTLGEAARTRTTLEFADQFGRMANNYISLPVRVGNHLPLHIRQKPTLCDLFHFSIYPNLLLYYLHECCHRLFFAFILTRYASQACSSNCKFNGRFTGCTEGLTYFRQYNQFLQSSRHNPSNFRDIMLTSV